MAWTDERIEQLKTLWSKGSTASQIADELGGVSRNAVIGKAHRLGLKARPSPVKTGEPIAATPLPEPRVEPQLRKTPTATVAEQPRPVSAATRAVPVDLDPDADDEPVVAVTPVASAPRVVSIGPGGFMRQGPGDQQAPIPPAPPRRLVPAKPSADIVGKTSLLDLNDKVCRWPMGHPGEPDFHFCGDTVNPGFPYCVTHCGRAYQAQLPRGSRRPPPPLPFGGPRVR